MIKIFYGISILTLFCFFQVTPSLSQEVLKKTSKELCLCLEETSKSDTLDLPPKQIFDKCTGASMANNRVALAEKYDMGTVSGIKALRDELVKELKMDCEQFIRMFTESLPKKN